MKEMWDKRYSSEAYAYGIEPNDFFAEQLVKLKTGKILLPAEGEGRNAVFAAKQGWDVSAFDFSKEAKAKSDKLAKANNISIDYQIGELNDIDLQESSFDAIGLIYAHFFADKKTSNHQKLNKYLKPGGVLILEGFSKSHIKVNKKNDKPMGPQNIDILFSIEEIKKEFHNYKILELKEEVITLSEGEFHLGKSSVIRFVGIKE